jgi:hypothetical protein
MEKMGDRHCNDGDPLKKIREYWEQAQKKSEAVSNY